MNHLRFLLLLSLPATLHGQLLLTEIQSNGLDDFWELTNTGDSSLDLSNYKWDDDSRTPASGVTIASGTMIASGESIVFTAADPAVFRSQWGIPASVQIIQGGPGLGSGDGIALFDAEDNEIFFFTYAADGFTRADGSASTGGHAGLSAGGTSGSQSAVWMASSGASSPRYTFADGLTHGTFSATASASDLGSPGYSGFGVAPPSITLSLEVTPATVSESAGSPISGVVSRTGPSSEPLEVTLNSSDTTEASVAATVTIPAGASSANFEIHGVDDIFPDGDQLVDITASAADATFASFEITVQDDGDIFPHQLLLTEIQSSQDGSPEDFWELTNIGENPADISGYSWSDSGGVYSAALDTVPADTVLAAGESIIFTQADAGEFRSFWGLPQSVKVATTPNAPGLGKNDGIRLFEAGGNEVFFLSYAADGFTRADGTASKGEHAGFSASPDGADEDLEEIRSMVWVPTSGGTSPRYTTANGFDYGTRSVTGFGDVASPGVTIGQPTVNIVASASVEEGDSGDSTLQLEVSRSDSSTAFSVDYHVSGGTATAGVDFSLAAGNLTFPADGAATLPIEITIHGDTDSESDETVIVTLDRVLNSSGSTIIGAFQSVVTIVNDDVIAPTFDTAPSGTTISDGGVATLSVSASGFPAPTYQWYAGDSGDTSSPIASATSSTFITPTLSETSNFWVRVTNAGGSLDSETMTVRVVDGIVAVDLSTYVRIGRYSLPEPTRTALPPGTPAHNLLCQEASGVAYNWDTDTLFISCDGGRSITQVSKTGELIDTMSLALMPGAPQGTTFYDPEGITYIGNGEFVFSEERDRQIVKFTYVAGGTLTRENAQTVDLGTFDDNTGTEGLSFDPLSSGFIVLKEKNPIGVFQTLVDFAAGTASNGSPTTTNSTNLFDTTLLGMTDVADVFALSNLPSMAGEAQQANLLVLGQEDARVVNIDRDGNIASTLQIVADPGSSLSAADQQHEGITMDGAGFIYIVNENGGGGIDYPELWVYGPSSTPNTAPTAIALDNAVGALEENTSTASPVKLADISVTDDGLGINELSLGGSDAEFFEIDGTTLFLKAGTVLDFESKTSYSISVSVDDSSLGATPDATAEFTLTVLDQEVETPPAAVIAITELAPWSSGNSPLGSDWFELTNISSETIDISGWRVDDSSASFASSHPLNGVTSIAPGESVIFIESSDLPAISASFLDLWFGTSPPAGLQIGSYNGSGIGLSTGGDAVNLYNSGGTLQASVSFGASGGDSPYRTFDNTLALDGVTLSELSEHGIHGAFTAANSATEIGSPGFSAPGVLRITEVAPWSSGNSPLGADWFEVTNIGARAVNLIGWKVDDGSESPAAAVPLSGIDSIAPGESVIFVESADPVAIKAAFLDLWFGANPPANLQVGAYQGSGIGLSTGGDAVNLYDANQVRVANVAFGIAASSAPFTSFDNSAAEHLVTLTSASAIGINGGFAAINDDQEIGSPGTAEKKVRIQILHASDLEGGVDAIDNAPGFAAIVEALENDSSFHSAGSILLSAGDNYIPGPFYNASGDQATFRDAGLFNEIYNTLFEVSSYDGLREGEGRVDISIMNILGFDASAIGNHEFDNSSTGLEVVIEEDFRSPDGPGSDRWVGAQFPYLSANLDFTADASLADLFTASILPHDAFASGPAESASGNGNIPKIAPATTITVGQETVGVIGATTQLLNTISSPSGTVGTAGSTNDMPALAAVLQPVIDDLLNGDDDIMGNADDVTKIVLVSHLQQISLEQELARLLRGIDVIIAGGSDTLLADSNDHLRAGDTAAGSYPFLTTNLDDEPVAIVSTDGEYSYVGRLVIDFDEEGRLLASSIDPRVSGVFASDETGVLATTGASTLEEAISASRKASEVEKLTRAVTGVIIAKDGDIRGYTDVYLEGRRGLVRTEEVTMGNITADANLAATRLLDPSVAVSIKNGGGIRASIGDIDGFTGELLPPQGNPLASKPAGAISLLDIENTLRFNNQLTILTLSASGLKAIIEHGVSASGPGNTPGQFPQVGGMSFSFDPALAPGSRVQSMAIFNDEGSLVDAIVQNGAILGDPDREIRVVTLNFMANPSAPGSPTGGDGYPFPSFAIGGPSTYNDTGIGEQTALSDFLLAKHATAESAYAMAETPKEQDGRIQQLDSRADGVLMVFASWLASNGYSGSFGVDSDGNGVFDEVEYFFNQNPNDPNDLGNLPQLSQDNGDLLLSFTVLAGTLDVSGMLECSHDLHNWLEATPGIDYEVVSETLEDGELKMVLRVIQTSMETPAGPFTYLTPFTDHVDGGALGDLSITNHGLVGVGRVSGNQLDAFGETMGAASGLFVSDWSFDGGQFAGTFHVLPDRGFNADVNGSAYFSNYAARVHELPFTFTPYSASSPTTQGQILASYGGSTKFTYLDGDTVKFTTGLNPTGTSTVFDQSVGTITAANGPGGEQTELLSFDAEAIHLFADGSGYVSDEYGTYIAHFDASKTITGITQLPESAQPHTPAGTLDFDSLAAPTNGRRNNQGLEGMTVTPDGQRLIAMMQSALVQDTGAGQQGRYHTRLYVYDIAGDNRETPVLIAEHVVQLPRYDFDGDGSGLDRSSAQSEIVAISSSQLLMLPRDGNGLGTSTGNPIVMKTVDLVDFSEATNILGLYDAEGDQVSPNAVLDSTIVPARSTVVINLQSSSDLAKFGLNVDTTDPDSNTLNEKMEGFALVPDLSTAESGDFFLFVANDNDFQSSDVRMVNAEGTLDMLGDQTVNGIVNDAMFYAYRISITSTARKFFRMDVTVDE
ncbi:lamin tail domain-containing protein [Haloferula chungangensis]|uniref:Lamin tail domain-containing protein n=1 Tax=Haloferula chungangensis TaxID=1048331 RepID=A0ABW2L3F3_9BACT